MVGPTSSLPPSPYSGPVKWAAVGALGTAAVGGLVWSLLLRQPRELSAQTTSAPQIQSQPAPQIVIVPMPVPQSVEQPSAPRGGAGEMGPPVSGPVPQQPLPLVIDNAPKPTLVSPLPVPIPTSPIAPMNPAAPSVVPIVVTPKPAPAPAPTNPQPKPAAIGGKININTATQAELELLPQIGPALAKRIIEAREKAPFRTFSDLDKVRGIGPKTIEKIRALIVFE